MPIPEASPGRHRSTSVSGPSRGQSSSSAERSRSSDSNTSFLQEGMGFAPTSSSSSGGDNHPLHSAVGCAYKLSDQKREYDFGPSSISPAGITPPFSIDNTLSRTPEGYAVALSGSVMRQREGFPPLIPAVNLLSTSPQFSSMMDINMLRSKVINQGNRLNESSKLLVTLEFDRLYYFLHSFNNLIGHSRLCRCLLG